MPEGHIVAVHARNLTEMFAGRIPALSSPQGRFTKGAQHLNGWRVLPVRTWGKHLFIPFAPPQSKSVQSLPDIALDRWRQSARGTAAFSASEHAFEDTLRWLHIHLGLYGKWRFYRDLEGDVPAARGQVRVRLATSAAVADLNGPNTCQVLSSVEVGEVLARLGVDPLLDLNHATEEFASTIRRSSRPVGALLMDQSVVAGPGNIYRAECLFRTGINPLRAGKNVSEKRLRTLYADLQECMAKGVKEELIVTVPSRMRPAETETDPEAQRFAVYQRQSRPCLRCGAPVRLTQLEGRKLYWCGGCQR